MAGRFFSLARILFASLSVYALCSVCIEAREARADEATVTVGRAGPRPPPHQPDALASDAGDDDSSRERERTRDVYRAPFRLQLGPSAITTGRGLGMGLGVAADFGRGTVGARIAAAWMRAERPSEGDTQASSVLASGLAQYTGELTLDLNKHGPVHPVLGMGFGVAHVSKSGTSGNAGVGIARLAIEYAIGLDDADVRIGGSITGALPGPMDRELPDLRPYAIVGGNIAIGF